MYTMYKGNIITLVLYKDIHNGYVTTETSNSI